MGSGSVPSSATPSAVPDVLAPGLDVVFCGINPGRVSDAAAAHFANPRNDFWRLLHDAGFTPRLLEPHEQFALLELGIGVTNAAYRTTKGSGDLRRADFAGSAERLESHRRRASSARDRVRRQGGLPRRLRRAGRARPADQRRSATSGSSSSRRRRRPTPPFRTPSACAGSRALRDWLEPVERPAARALVVDRHDRTLLVLFRDDDRPELVGHTGRRRGRRGEHRADDPPRARRGGRARRVRARPRDLDARPHLRVVRPSIYRQRERIHLVRVDEHEPAPAIDLAAEHVHERPLVDARRVETTRPRRSCPRTFPRLLRELLERGPPAAPFDVGI